MATGKEVNANSRDKNCSYETFTFFTLVVFWRTILIWFYRDHQPQGTKWGLPHRAMGWVT